MSVVGWGAQVLQFSRFQAHVKSERRYLFDEQHKQFLEAVIGSCQKRKLEIPGGTRLWRAVVDHRIKSMVTEDGDEEIHPAEGERMFPRKDRASEGRVNPKGIPCLYCSTLKETAMKEVRPWIGAYVSVGEFEVVKTLNLVDCSVDRGTSGFLKREGEEVFWRHIDRAFTEPVTRLDDVADYVPTQVLSEAFRTAGFDGVAYGSSLGEGRNIAIFDVTKAVLCNCHVYQVKSVEMKFSEAGPSYQCSLSTRKAILSSQPQS